MSRPTTVPKPCIVCGELSEAGRCAQHEAQATTRPSYRDRGYDSAWDRLSRRARQRQDFCTRCGSMEKLSTDHTPEAWHAKANGRPITLRMVQVLCAACQSAVGSSRPGSPRYAEWLASRAGR